MKLQRDWITPITMGAFGLLATTGVLMFFHIDSGLNEAVHEWLSWVLLGGVALHAAVNWAGVRRHLAGWRGRAAVGVFAAVLAHLPGRDPGDLADAPLTVLAQVARVTPGQMRERLQGQGLAPTADADTVRSLVGDDTRAQIRVLSKVLAAG